jgi:hypothetical protein
LENPSSTVNGVIAPNLAEGQTIPADTFVLVTQILWTNAQDETQVQYVILPPVWV